MCVLWSWLCTVKDWVEKELGFRLRSDLIAQENEEGRVTHSEVFTCLGRCA